MPESRDVIRALQDELNWNDNTMLTVLAEFLTERGLVIDLAKLLEGIAAQERDLRLAAPPVRWSGFP